ncbi:MAG TPA: hypothetical protein VMJ10_23640 [Kofleriaceae bacterium]|nr:hypothetical protein [Kofleriaceae bacterium]
MRTLVVLLAFARTATAGPIEKKCYDGTETADGKSQRIIAVREADRDAGEIRQHEWRAANPRRERVQTYKVAADGASFTFRHGAIEGKGTLQGPAWKWTSYHEVVELPNGYGSLTADGKLGGDALAIRGQLERTGKAAMSFDIAAKAFDCAELDKRRASLDDTAPDASHACFEGTQSSGSDKHHVVIEQVFEPRRIQLLVTGKIDSRVTFAIDGKAIAVTRDTLALGNGELIGKPGAWTGYKYGRDLTQFTMTTEGTLGGTHFHQTTVAHGKTELTTTLDGDALDCKKVAARRAALATGAP